MSRDKGQIFAFNKKELELIKTMFAENEALLYSIRKSLLQFPLTPAEKELIRQLLSEEVYAVVKKRVFPDLEYDAPLGQLMDYRTMLTQKLNSLPIEDMFFPVAVSEIVMDYLAQQFEILKDLDKEPKIKLLDLRETKGKDSRKGVIELKAYLDIIGYIDPMVNHLKVLAGTKEETPEEQSARLRRNSTE